MCVLDRSKYDWHVDWQFCLDEQLAPTTHCHQCGEYPKRKIYTQWYITMNEMNRALEVDLKRERRIAARVAQLGTKAIPNVSDQPLFSAVGSGGCCWARKQFPMSVISRCFPRWALGVAVGRAVSIASWGCRDHSAQGRGVSARSRAWFAHESAEADWTAWCWQDSRTNRVGRSRHWSCRTMSRFGSRQQWVPGLGSRPESVVVV